MAKFVELQGYDPNAIYASVRQAPQDNAAHNHDIVYVPLPHRLMLEIYDFYHTQEPLINMVAQIKNFHSLGDDTEIVATYGGRELEHPERRQVNEALNRLLPEMRSWNDMFGFVGIFDPNAYQDRQVIEIAEADAPSSGAYELRADLVDNAEDALDSLAPLLGQARVDALKDATLDAARQNEPPPPPPSSSSSSSQRRQPQPQKQRVDELDVQIRREPRFSALSAPNSFAVIKERDAQSATATTTTAANSDNNNNDDDDDEAVPRLRVKTRRSLLQTIAGISDFRSVSLKEGRFYLERDRLSGNERVVYARNEHNTDLFTQYDQSGGGGSGQQTAATTSALNIDADVHVFVWPGRMPLHDGRLNTKMEEVMRMRDLYAQSEENLMHADRNRTHPTAIYEYQMPRSNGDVTRLTDQQLHFGRGEDEDAALAERYRQQGRDLAAFEAHAELINGKRQDELTRRLAEGVERPTVRGIDGRRRLALRQEDRYINLPEGFRFAGTLPSDTLSNPTEMRVRYQSALTASLGMPLSRVEGGGTMSTQGRYSGSSGGSMSSGSASLASSASTEAIMTDRHILRQGIGGLYNLMFRHVDNEMIEQMLANADTSASRQRDEISSTIDELRRKVDSVSDAAERSRLAQNIEANNSYLTAVAARYERIAMQLREIVSMDYRFEIEFMKMTHIEMGDLLALKENYAISQFQFVNALRQRVGMRSLQSEAEMTANREQALKLEEEQQERRLKLQAKYAAKPGGGAGGGAAAGDGAVAVGDSNGGGGGGGAAKNKRKAESTVADDTEKKRKKAQKK